MFRYKKRLFMMLVGIGCCAGLVVTAFGIRDSMVHIADKQFGSIQTYDIEAAFDVGAEEEILLSLEENEEITDYLTASTHHVDLHGKSGSMKSVAMMGFRTYEMLDGYWNFSLDGRTVDLPERGEVIINEKIADNLGVSEGDMISLQTSDLKSSTFVVGGVFENYILNYVMISEETYRDAFGEWMPNVALLKVDGDHENVARELTATDRVTSVSMLSTSRSTINEALSALNYIIWLVVFFSGALAFIVVFNLTNINLAERSREIATVEVLGFYPKETNSYVLRENLVLSIIAAIVGLPLGYFFHRVVMSMVIIDLFTFDIHVTVFSYLLGPVFTVIFTLIVNRFMRRHIKKIKMAESLKAVE